MRFGYFGIEPAQTSELAPGALHLGRLHDAVLPAHTSDGVTATIERSHQHEAASSPLSAVSSRYSWPFNLVGEVTDFGLDSSVVSRCRLPAMSTPLPLICCEAYRRTRRVKPDVPAERWVLRPILAQTVRIGGQAGLGRSDVDRSFSCS